MKYAKDEAIVVGRGGAESGGDTVGWAGETGGCEEVDGKYPVKCRVSRKHFVSLQH